MSSILLALALFVSGSPAQAPESRSPDPIHFAEGGRLFRAGPDGVVVSDGGFASEWAPILGPEDPLLSDRTMSAVVCAATARDLCLLGLTDGTERGAVWVLTRFTESGPTVERVSALDGALVHDVSVDDGGTVAFTRRDAAGLHLLKLAEDGATEIISVDVFNNQQGVARFVPAGDGRQGLVALEAGSPVQWVLVDGERDVTSRTPAVGRAFALSGTDLVTAVEDAASSDSLPEGAIVLMQPPRSASAPWRKAILFASPHARLGRRPWEEPAGAGLSTFRGGLVAAVRTDAGSAVREICGRPGDTRARETARPLEGFADMYLDGGGTLSVATAVNLWGDSSQHVIETPSTSGPAPLRPCDAQPLIVRDLAGSPSRPELRAVRHEVQGDAALGPHYLVIGQVGATGPVMIRPYGAFGLPVQGHAVGALERAWLERGGRLLIPTIAGDAGAAPSYGSYKAEAVADLIAVVEDADRRGIGSRGRYVLSGSSAGAFVAAKSALVRPDLFDSVVIFAGALDLELLADTPVRLAEFGEAEGGFARWYGGVPAPVDAPEFLLWFAENDERVPVATGERFAQYLKSLGYGGELTISDRGGHGVGARDDTAAPALAFIDGAAKP